MKERRVHKGFGALPSARTLLIIIVITIFLTEATVMAVLHSFLPRLGILQTMLLDSGILICITFPALYFLMYSPMRRSFGQLDFANRQLSEERENLERKVSERTVHLQTANEELEGEISLRRETERLLSVVAERVSQKTGMNFFESLLEFLSTEVEADYALLGEYRPGEQSVSTVSVYANGQLTANFEYKLDGTPCENVVGKDVCFYPRGIQELFPKDTMLADMDAEGYMGIPMFNSDGSPSGIIAILTKAPMEEARGERIRSLLKILSVRVESEMEHRTLYGDLAASEKRFRELAELLPGFVLELDTDGKIQFANQNALNTTGYFLEELESGFDVIVPPQRDEARKNLRLSLSGKKNFISRYLFRKKSGETFPAIVNSGPFYDWEGKVAGIRVVALDITDMEAAERALRESEEKYRAVFEATSAAMMIVERDLSVSLVNKRMAELTGYSKDEIMGHGDCRPMMPEELCEEMAALLESGSHKAVSRDSVIEASDRGPRNVSVNMALMPERNSLLVSMQDMTEMYMYQEEALRAAHLASIGELAAGVAHEVNNPINIILLEAQVLSKTLSKKAESSGRLELETGLSQIIRECNRITSIVKSLLSFARKDDEERISVSVGELVEEAVSITGHLFRKSSIEVMQSFDDRDAQVLVNPKQIVQVFLNILMNSQFAIDSKYKNPSPDKVLEIGMRKKGSPEGFLRIAFLDRGVGMSSEVIRNATTPFFTTKPKHTGTGLGLSISYSLIRQNGGNMLFESEEGKYTRVIIDLPKAVGNEE